jgi:asparagine synthase (glutamine-hydrolysing)
MCGIIGALGDKVFTRLPLDKLAHRGPDASDSWTNNRNCVLGHTRLSIMDLNSRSNQPMTDKSGRYHMVYNGEIYNYSELAKTYLGDVKLATTSDSEVLLQLWVKLGTECIKLLRGMFAFAIWDDKEEQLFLVRDRLGQKPLFYHLAGKNISFSSELNALSEIQSNLSISSKAIDLFLSNQFIPTPNSIYEDVFKLPPGSYATWRNGKFELNTYYKLRFDHKLNEDLSESDAIKQLEDIIIESIKLRLRSDVPVGSLLSGGVDSSLVTALAAKVGTGRLKTFSIGFKESAFNELEYARIVADKYNTEHTENIFDEEDALNLLMKSTRQYGEPFGDKSSLASLLVCSIAGKNVPVVLSGDGGDEVLAGYSKYRLDSRHALSSIFPIHSNSYHQMANNLQFSKINKYFQPNSFFAKSLKYLEPLSGVTRFNEFFTPFHMHQYYNKDFLRDVLFARKEHISQLISDISLDNHILNKMLSLDYKNYFADDLLVKMDIASMAYSLEVRSPLLDASLMEYAASLPIKFKQKAGTGKYLLKRLAESYLPKDLIYRPKQGFSIPVSKWLSGGLREPLEEILHSENHRVWEYLNRTALVKLYDRGNGIAKNASRFWVFLNLSLWLQQDNRR